MRSEFEMRIIVGPNGVLKVQVAAEKLEAQMAATALYERLVPAIRKLDQAVRREMRSEL